MTTPVDTSKKTSCIVGERTIPIGDTITAYPSDYSSGLRRDCYINEANEKAHPDRDERINWCDTQVVSFYDSLKDTYICSDTGQLLDITTKTPFDKAKKKTATFAPSGKSMDYNINSMTLYDHLTAYELKASTNDADKVKLNDLIHAQVKYLPTELQTQLITAMDSTVAGKLQSTNVKLYDSPTALCKSSTQSIGLNTNGLMYMNPIDFNTKCESSCEFKTNDHDNINLRNNTTHTLYKHPSSNNCGDLMVQVKCDNGKLLYNDNFDGTTYVPHFGQNIFTNCSAPPTPSNNKPDNKSADKSSDKPNDKSDDNSSMMSIIWGILAAVLICACIAYGIYYYRTQRGNSSDADTTGSYDKMPDVDAEYGNNSGADNGDA